MKIRKPPFALLMGAVLAAVVSTTTAAEIPKLDAAGFTELLGANRGKVVMVDFWATWCPPCKEALPALNELFRKYRASGLELVGVSLDAESKLVEHFLEEMGIDFPVYMGASDLKRSQRVSIIPTNLLFDRTGGLAFRHVGHFSPEVLEDEIRQLLDR